MFHSPKPFLALLKVLVALSLLLQGPLGSYGANLNLVSSDANRKLNLASTDASEANPDRLTGSSENWNFVQRDRPKAPIHIAVTEPDDSSSFEKIENMTPSTAAGTPATRVDLTATLDSAHFNSVTTAELWETDSDIGEEEEERVEEDADDATAAAAATPIVVAASTTEYDDAQAAAVQEKTQKFLGQTKDAEPSSVVADRTKEIESKLAANSPTVEHVTVESSTTTSSRISPALSLKLKDLAVSKHHTAVTVTPISKPATVSVATLTDFPKNLIVLQTTPTPAMRNCQTQTDVIGTDGEDVINAFLDQTLPQLQNMDLFPNPIAVLKQPQPVESDPEVDQPRKSHKLEVFDISDSDSDSDARSRSSHVAKRAPGQHRPRLTLCKMGVLGLGVFLSASFVGPESSILPVVGPSLTSESDSTGSETVSTVGSTSNYLIDDLNLPGLQLQREPQSLSVLSYPLLTPGQFYLFWIPSKPTTPTTTVPSPSHSEFVNLFLPALHDHIRRIFLGPGPGPDSQTFIVGYGGAVSEAAINAWLGEAYEIWREMDREHGLYVNNRIGGIGDTEGGDLLREKSIEKIDRFNELCGMIGEYSIIVDVW